MEWQPIETAPRDDVIVLTDGGQLWQGFWAKGYGWITGFDAGQIHVRISLYPTHWMPLPESPLKAASAPASPGPQP